MDEEKLIEEAKAGDKKALTELVKKYEQTIYNFAFKKITIYLSNIS